MQKTIHGPKDTYSVAMSMDTGCVVMLKNSRVQGSMTRADSLEFAKKLMAWKQSVDSAVKDQLPKPVLSVVRTEEAPQDEDLRSQLSAMVQGRVQADG